MKAEGEDSSQSEGLNKYKRFVLKYLKESDSPKVHSVVGKLTTRII